MRLRRAISYSLLLHVLPLVVLGLLSGAGKGNGKGQHQAESDLKSFQPRPDAGGEPVDVELIHDEDLAIEKKKQKAKKQKNDCEGAWYGGIGISQSWNESYIFVLDVAQGYSADRAGIRVGDRIQSLGEIRGNPGTDVTIRVTKPNGESKEVTLTREKICYDKIDTAPERPGYDDFEP